MQLRACNLKLFILSEASSQKNVLVTCLLETDVNLSSSLALKIWSRNNGNSLFCFKVQKYYKMMTLQRIYSGFCNFYVRGTIMVRVKNCLFNYASLPIFFTIYCLHFKFPQQISKTSCGPRLETLLLSTSSLALWTTYYVYR